MEKNKEEEQKRKTSTNDELYRESIEWVCMYVCGEWLKFMEMNRTLFYVGI